MAMAARPGEVSITKWLDPVFEYFAREAGIPTADYTAQVGGEGIGVGLELLADYFTKGWLNKVVQAGAGLLADAYAIWGKNVSIRLRKELLALGTHELLRIVKLTPEEMGEIQRSVENTMLAIKSGDVNAFMASVLKTPSEIGLAPAGAPPFTPAAPTAYPPPAAKAPAKYSVSKEAAAPTTTVKGRYQVTG
jgi:hypothetical protein